MSKDNTPPPQTQPFAWYWYDATGCLFITGDERKPDAPADANPLYASPPPQPHLVMDTSILRERISRAIFDPGQTEGYKGHRTLTDWQTDAVMRVLGFAALATTEGS